MLGTAYQAPLELMLPEGTRGLCFEVAKCVFCVSKTLRRGCQVRMEVSFVENFTAF